MNLSALALTGFAAALITLTGCNPEVVEVDIAQKDFFECGAANTLVACPVGKSPDPAVHGDCRSVGDGDTTLGSGTCL